ncbi:putative immunoglobulin-like 1, partial [Homarus americanus]
SNRLISKPILSYNDLFPTATTIRVERVVVPPVVLAGRRVKLECQYKEEGDKLYSLKWWRNDDQFYQFIPPDRKHFKVPGVTVNFTASYTLSAGSRGQEVVVLEPVDLEAAGVYKCEVMADVNFQTEFRQANMTVMYAPEGPPIITPGPKTDTSNITAGQLVVLNCYSSPASPPPVHTWYINGRHVPAYTFACTTTTACFYWLSPQLSWYLLLSPSPAEIFFHPPVHSDDN